MNNMGMLMQAMKNPQEFLQNITNNSPVMKNPIAKNAIEMYQKGDTEGINKLVNNLCNEKGIEPEQAYKQVKSMFGM